MQNVAVQPGSAETASIEARASFIGRTYNTLFIAILVFAGLEIMWFQTGLALPIAQLLGGNWLIALGGFMVVSWFASRTAMRTKSQPAAYAALGAFVVMESLIFLPLLYMANQVAPGAIQSAALTTMLGFAGLTAIAWISRKDFSFLGGLLKWGFVVALVLIVASVIFSFNLGTLFSVGMVGLAGAAILYDTSNVLRYYPTDRHAAAALSLFSSVALMFYYVLMLFSSRD